MSQPLPEYFTAARGPAGDVTVKLWPDRDAAEWEWHKLHGSDARKVGMGRVPSAVAARPDAADVLRQRLVANAW